MILIYGSGNLKKFLIFIILIMATFNVHAMEKYNVAFSKCVDGDTAKVILNNEEVTLRFLAIDTPETKHPKKGEEPYGKEASNYTCNALKTAKKIEIEYDAGSDKVDKYNRHLVWIYVDNDLLQGKLIEKGLAKVAYIYGDYKYTKTLEAKESVAKINKTGIWSDTNEESSSIILIFIFIIIIIIDCLINKRFRKKVINKVKRKTKNKIKKLVK